MRKTRKLHLVKETVARLYLQETKGSTGIFSTQVGNTQCSQNQMSYTLYDALCMVAVVAPPNP